MIDRNSEEGIKIRTEQADALSDIIVAFLGEDLPFLIVYADCLEGVSEIAVNTDEEERQNIAKLIMGIHGATPN